MYLFSAKWILYGSDIFFSIGWTGSQETESFPQLWQMSPAPRAGHINLSQPVPAKDTEQLFVYSPLAWNVINPVNIFLVI